MAEGEILTYGTIKNMAGNGKAAYANQIWDEEQQKFQSEINMETTNDGLVSAKVVQSFTNSEKEQARNNIGAVSALDVAALISTNGHLYKGVATLSTNPEAPTINCFYLSCTSGTYTNFGNLVLPQGINVLKYNGSSWSAEPVVGIEGELFKGDEKFPNNGNLFNRIMQLATSIGYDKIPIALTNGKQITSDGTLETNANTKASNFISVSNIGLYMVYSLLSQNWYIAFYSSPSESGFISSVKYKKHSTQSPVMYMVDVPDGATYMRVTVSSTFDSPAVYQLKALSSEIARIGNIENNIGYSEPVNIALTNLTSGYINANGGVSSSTGGKYSEFISVNALNKYTLKAACASTWYIAYYYNASESSFISSQQMPNSASSLVEIPLILPDSANYVRVTVANYNIANARLTYRALRNIGNEVDEIKNDGNVYRILKDGTGDYPTLVSALAALRNDNSKKTIYVESGEYDVLEQMGGQDFLDSIPSDVDSSEWPTYSNYVSNNTTIIGEGEVILNFNPPSNTPSAKIAVICPMAFRDSVTLENITINASYCRYGIHDEQGAVATGHIKKFKNVKVYKTGGSSYIQAYAGGILKNSVLIFENCLFSSNGDMPWYTHNNSNNNYSTILFSNCAFISNLSSFSALYLKTGNTSGGQINVQVNNCTLGGGKIQLKDSSSYHNLFKLTVIKSGNPEIIADSSINPITPTPLIVE